MTFEAMLKSLDKKHPVGTEYIFSDDAMERFKEI